MCKIISANFFFYFHQSGSWASFNFCSTNSKNQVLKGDCHTMISTFANKCWINSTLRFSAYIWVIYSHIQGTFTFFRGVWFLMWIKMRKTPWYGSWRVHWIFESIHAVLFVWLEGSNSLCCRYTRQYSKKYIFFKAFSLSLSHSCVYNARQLIKCATDHIVYVYTMRARNANFFAGCHAVTFYMNWYTSNGPHTATTCLWCVICSAHYRTRHILKTRLWLLCLY